MDPPSMHEVIAFAYLILLIMLWRVWDVGSYAKELTKKVDELSDDVRKLRAIAEAVEESQHREAVRSLEALERDRLTEKQQRIQHRIAEKQQRVAERTAEDQRRVRERSGRKGPLPLP